MSAALHTRLAEIVDDLTARRGDPTDLGVKLRILMYQVQGLEGERERLRLALLTHADACSALAETEAVERAVAAVFGSIDRR